MKKFIAALLLGMAILSASAMAVSVAGVTIPSWWEQMDEGDTVATGAYNVITATADCEFEPQYVSSSMGFSTDNAYAYLSNGLTTGIEGVDVGVSKQFTSQSGSALVQTSEPYDFDAQKSQSKITTYAAYDKSQMALFSGMLVADKEVEIEGGSGCYTHCSVCGKHYCPGHEVVNYEEPAFVATFGDYAQVGAGDYCDWVGVAGYTDDATVKVSIESDPWSQDKDAIEDAYLYEAYGAQSSSAAVTETMFNIKGAGCPTTLTTVDGEAGLLGGFKGAVIPEGTYVNVDLDGGENSFWLDEGW